jgi:hypothetical protein
MLQGQKRCTDFFLLVFRQIDKVGISVIQTDPEFLKVLGMIGEDKNAKIGLLLFVFTIAYRGFKTFFGLPY